MTEIGDYAFYECNALTSINIPESVTKIGKSAFSWCKALTSVTIPNSVTEIGDSAFSECYALKSINIPNSVTEIGAEAFSGCEALTSINIPESVTWIGEDAFIGCGELTSIIVAEENKVYDSRNNYNAIIETKTNRLIQGCANTVIPDSVTWIGDWAFSGCTALTSITIPNSVTWIGNWVFSGCENLKETILFQTDPSKIKVTENSGLQKTQITLYVPKEGVTAFQEHWFWSEFAAIKPITDDMLK